MIFVYNFIFSVLDTLFFLYENFQLNGSLFATGEIK